MYSRHLQSRHHLCHTLAVFGLHALRQCRLNASCASVMPNLGQMSLLRMMFPIVSHFLVRRVKHEFDIYIFLIMKEFYRLPLDCLGLTNFSSSSKQITAFSLSYKNTSLQLNPYLSTPFMLLLTLVYHPPLQLIPSPPQSVYRCICLTLKGVSHLLYRTGWS